jgi:hypothetical protein
MSYELNRHFQDNWAMKLLWAEFVLGFNGESSSSAMQDLHLNRG